MAIVTLRFWAAAKEAAGTAELKVDAATLADALAAARAAARDLGPEERERRLSQVLSRSSFLIDGVQAGSKPPELVALTESAVIEVLPPFAGG